MFHPNVIVIYRDSFLLIWFSGKIEIYNDLDHVDNNHESGEIFFSLSITVKDVAHVGKFAVTVPCLITLQIILPANKEEYPTIWWTKNLKR